MVHKYHKRNRILYLLKYSLGNIGLIRAVLHKNRLFNLLLNWYEQKIGRVGLRSYPYLLQIEPICGCNLKCPLCPVGNNTINRKRGVMSYENYVKIVQKLGDHLVHISFWNWGEPLLNKDIFKMVSYAKKKRIHTLIATNGYFVTKNISKKLIESGLDELRISLDGASKESYEKYRKNSDFNLVLDNITYFIKKKNKVKKVPKVTLQFIVMKHNQHEIPLMKEIFQKIKADYLSIKTVSAHNDQKGIEKFLPDYKELSRFIVDGNKIKPKESKICYLPWQSILVNWDGTVTACCRDVDAKYGFGNILNQDLDSIWSGEGYIRFRKSMLKDIFSLNLCRTCSASQERYIE